MATEPKALRLSARAAPPPAIQQLPDVKLFFTQVVEASPEMQQARATLLEAERIIGDLNTRLEQREHEFKTKFEQREHELRTKLEAMQQDNRRLSLQLNTWIQTANELNVQLRVIANTAEQSCNHAKEIANNVGQQARASLEAAQQHLARNGLAMVEASASNDIPGGEHVFAKKLSLKADGPKTIPEFLAVGPKRQEADDD
jgi:hypothetical protein